MAAEVAALRSCVKYVFYKSAAYLFRKSRIGRGVKEAVQVAIWPTAEVFEFMGRSEDGSVGELGRPDRLNFLGAPCRRTLQVSKVTSDRQILAYG